MLFNKLSEINIYYNFFNIDNITQVQSNFTSIIFFKPLNNIKLNIYFTKLILLIILFFSFWQNYRKKIKVYIFIYEVALLQPQEAMIACFIPLYCFDQQFNTYTLQITLSYLIIFIFLIIEKFSFFFCFLGSIEFDNLKGEV